MTSKHQVEFECGGSGTLGLDRRRSLETFFFTFEELALIDFSFYCIWLELRSTLELKKWIVEDDGE